ncbi:MAG: pimeloyl-ACP methyl ester esterase BioH [Gammaproteobacteria bacterium]
MTTIHHETFAKEKGRPIVLVHGWAMHSGIWRSFAESLAERHRVICVDLPGHGLSQRLSPFTLEHISTALADAIDEPNCCWLGWSLGASVVLDLADRFPDRVSSLILLAGNPSFTRSYFSPAGTGSNPGAWPGMDARLLASFSEHFAGDPKATLINFLALQVHGLPEAKTLLKILKAEVLARDPPDAETLRQGLRILKEADLRPVLARLKVPVAAILGGRDTLVPVAVGQRMQNLLPSLQLNVLDKAGHVPFLSHQADVVTTISRFLDRT